MRGWSMLFALMLLLTISMLPIDALPVAALHATDHKVLTPPLAPTKMDLRPDWSRFQPLPALFLASFRYCDSFDGAWSYDYANRKTAVSYFTAALGASDEMVGEHYILDYLEGWEKLFRVRSRAKLSPRQRTLSAMDLTVAAASGELFVSEHCEQFDLPAPLFHRMFAPDSARQLSHLTIDSEGAGFIEADSALSGNYLVSLRGENPPWLYTQTTFGRNGSLFAIKVDAREWRFAQIVDSAALVICAFVMLSLICWLTATRSCEARCAPAESAAAESAVLIRGHAAIRRGVCCLHASSKKSSFVADVAIELQAYLPFLLVKPGAAEQGRRSSTGAG